MARNSGMDANMQRQQIAAQNLQNRAILVRNCTDAWLPIAQGTFSGLSALGQVVNVPVRNVGLIKRFLIEISVAITNGSGALTLLPLGASNTLSNVVLTDLSNQTRINTSGAHLCAVSSNKGRMPWGCAATTDTPLGYGNIFTTTIAAPASISGSGSGTIYMMYEVPVSYSDSDLRGAIYANVVNATMNLQFTVNPALAVSSAVTDPVLSVYQSASAVLPSNYVVTYTVYQNFLDQIPIGQNGQPILPLIDLSTAYMLNTTAMGGLVANQDNGIAYANFRDFLSTWLIYDNAGTLNIGTDISYLAISCANYANIMKVDPKILSVMSRQRIQDDMPKGTYFFDHRARPINTVQFGNMQLIVNPSSVTAGAQFIVGFESLAMINMITQAGSLPST